MNLDRKENKNDVINALYCFKKSVPSSNYLCASFYLFRALIIITRYLYLPFEVILIMI